VRDWQLNGSARIDTRYPWFIRSFADRLPNWLLNLYAKVRRHGWW
jgi:hypothetical protein